MTDAGTVPAPVSVPNARSVPNDRAPWLVRNAGSGAVVATRVREARSFWGRFRGLMGRRSLAPGEGLYLPDNSIHMFFMRFPIDALFVAAPEANGERRIVAVRSSLRPWTGIVLPVRGASGVVELAAGAVAHADLQAGGAVRFESAPGTDPTPAPAS